MTTLDWPTVVPELTDGSLTLREWGARDVDAVFQACQDADTRRWMDIPVPYLEDYAADFVGEQSRQQWSSKKGAPFAISCVDDDRILGSCGLVGVNAQHLVAEVVYAVTPWARGRKVAQRAVSLLCDWAFAELGLQRLEFYIDPANHGSRAVAERLNCQYEGTLRSKSLIQGIRRDMTLYALLK